MRVIPRGPLAALAALCCIAGCGLMSGGGPPPPPPGAVVASVAVGAPPTFLALSPDGANLYAASNGELRVIRTADHSVAATLRINPNPNGMAVSPDGAQVYITNLFSVALTTLDTATNTLAPPTTLFMQRFRGGFGRMAVAPDGRTIYVANAVNRAFGIVDLTGGNSSVLIPSVMPQDIAVTADGRTVYYVGCRPICTPGFLQVFDVPTGRFLQSVALSGNPFRIALSPDGARAYAANLTGPSLSVVDLANLTVTATVPVPVQPTGLAVARDGSAIYVASQTGGALTVIDPASLSVRASAAIPQAREVVVSPDGRRAYVSSNTTVLAIDTAALLAGAAAP